MKQNERLARVAGIPVGVNWSVADILVTVADLGQALRWRGLAGAGSS
jgi:methylglyoxal synthase